jgi:hypothetical protein
MSRRMDWRRARLAGKPILDYRREHEFEDRADRRLKAVERRQRERRRNITWRSTTASSSSEATMAQR